MKIKGEVRKIKDTTYEFKGKKFLEDKETEITFKRTIEDNAGEPHLVRKFLNIKKLPSNKKGIKTILNI